MILEPPASVQKLRTALQVKAKERRAGRRALRVVCSPTPHGMLAMKTGHRHELIQDACFLAPLAFRVSLADRYHQFISRRRGHRLIPASAPGYQSGANQMRQRVSIREHL